MIKVYSVEQRRVCQHCRIPDKRIFTLTAKFPDAVEFGIVGQLCRLGIFVVSNIAKGFLRKNLKDKTNFLQSLSQTSWRLLGSSLYVMV